MSESELIVNKVAKSGLVTLDLEALFLPKTTVESLDIKKYLYMELLLREADFRQSMDGEDFGTYRGKIVALHCSSDAIIPEWAWMLAVSKVIAHAEDVQFGTVEAVRSSLMLHNAQSYDWSQHTGKKVLLKGCGDDIIPSSLYLHATKMLMKYADRVMYGEACSFVPVWRR